METDTKPDGTGAVGTDVPHWWETTSRGYEVTGPDRDGDMCVEFDVETNIIWLTRRDVEMLLSRWTNTATSPKESP